MTNNLERESFYINQTDYNIGTKIVIGDVSGDMYYFSKLKINSTLIEHISRISSNGTTIWETAFGNTNFAEKSILVDESRNQTTIVLVSNPMNIIKINPDGSLGI